MKHGDLIEKVRALAKKADRGAAAGAWIASLGTKPGPWRGVLAGLAAAERVPTHPYVAFSASSDVCRECGAAPVTVLDALGGSDPGGVLPGDMALAYDALTWARAQTDPPSPTPADVARLGSILALVGKLPASAREGRFNDALRAKKLVVGNRYAVRAAIETLGALGILETPEHPGFTTKWTSFAARQARPSTRVECDPPIAFWTAAHGVNATRVDEWFGAFGVKAHASSKPRSIPVATASASQARRDARAARSTELELGDVITVQIGEAWRAAIVIGHARDRGGRTPVLQPSSWSGTAPPSRADIQRASRAPFWCRIDLWVRDDPKERWRTVGRVAAKAPKQLAPYVVLSSKHDGLPALWKVRPLPAR